MSAHAPRQLGEESFSLVRITECLLRILGSSTVNIERGYIFFICRVLDALDRRDKAKSTKLARIEYLILRLKRLVLFPPFQRFRQLRLGLGEIVYVRSQELLQDNEGGVWSCLPNFE